MAKAAKKRQPVTRGNRPASSGSNPTFRQYDPFLTFHDGVIGHFVSPKGRPLNNSSVDIQALYRVAQFCYEKLRDHITSRNNFEAIQAEYLQWIANYRSWFTEPFTDHFPEWIRGDIETTDWNHASDSKLVSIVIKMHRVATRGATPDALSETRNKFLLHALREIDSTIALIERQGVGAVASAIGVCEAMFVYTRIEAINTAKSLDGYFKRKTRKETDPKHQDKLNVYACWKLWRGKPSNYTSKAAFARDMREKYQNLISTKVIEDWCRKWERGNTP
jgi:hypothetical protein